MLFFWRGIGGRFSGLVDDLATQLLYSLNLKFDNFRRITFPLLLRFDAISFCFTSAFKRKKELLPKNEPCCARSAHD